MTRELDAPVEWAPENAVVAIDIVDGESEERVAFISQSAPHAPPSVGDSLVLTETRMEHGESGQTITHDEAVGTYEVQSRECNYRRLVRETEGEERTVLGIVWQLVVIPMA